MASTEQKLNELEVVFKTIKLPTTVQLDAGTTIVDVRTFIESHLSVLRQGGGKPIYDVFYSRLLRLKEILAAQDVSKFQ